MRRIYTFTNESGTADYIIISALHMAREEAPFRFENIGKIKMNHMWKYFDKQVEIMHRNKALGNDMTETEKALNKVYEALIEIIEIKD